MSRLVVSVMTSLDGYFDGEGEGYERIRWFRADQEWFDYSVELLSEASALLFGRVTFEGMAEYWPSQTDPVARYMNALPKVGFSRTPRKTSWQNARYESDVAKTVAELKQQLPKDLLVLGSADLAATLTEAKLVDEYLVAVNPVVLGGGTPLFPRGRELSLKLLGQRTFRSGIVQLKYAPE